MRRRDLIAAAAALSAVASTAAAEDAPASGQSVSMPGVGLPIIAGGRLLNYAFVSLRLHLGGSATPETIRSKEAYLRDALVRAGHRTPFVVAGDLTRIDPAALSASLIRSASAIVGRGSVTRVEIISQAPRRRTVTRTG